MISHLYTKPHYTLHNPNSINYKTRTSPLSPVSARSHPRDYPHIWNTTTDMTKTSSNLHPISTNTINQPPTHYINSSTINHSRGLRRTKPNTTTQNHSLFINCPYRMNNNHHLIQFHNLHTKPNHLYPAITIFTNQQ
jgi:hypothetical protein